MSRLAHILVLLLPSWWSQAQYVHYSSVFEQRAFENIQHDTNSKHKLALFFAIDSSMTDSAFNHYYEALTLESQGQGFDKKPQRLFQSVQDMHLQHFDQQAVFPEIMQSQRFNCVSGTALLAFFLEQNDYQYHIEEMPFHVFLSIAHKGKEYILESTDTAVGFFKDNEANRKMYSGDTIDNSVLFQLVGANTGQRYGLVVKGEIDLLELAGLAYYNDAVKLINQGKWRLAARQLEKAFILYPSQRINELYKYSIIQLLNDEHLGQKAMEYYLQELLKHTYQVAVK
ncbi:MAG: hypothetical protein HYZ16_03250 [Bacteroidetes bacterium]|jgi:hypothetical protein|nr:hypothetical protein [Bacteroidota bacterium]